MLVAWFKEVYNKTLKLQQSVDKMQGAKDKGKLITPLLTKYKTASYILFAITLVLGCYFRILSHDARQVFPDAKRRVLFLVVGTILQLIHQGLAFLTFNSYFSSELQQQQQQPSEYAKSVAILLWYFTTAMHLQSLSQMYGYLQSPLFVKLVSLPMACFSILSFIIAITWPVVKLLSFVLKQQNLIMLKKILFHVALLISLMGLMHTVYPTDPEDLYASVYNDASLLTLKHPMNQSAQIKVIQMSDIHLGPQMSVESLHGIASSLVAKYKAEMIKDPNSNIFVLLTGDYYTFSSHMETNALIKGLAPLKHLPGKVFACLGNHDHEVIEAVTRQMDILGIRLLVDESVSVPLNEPGQFIEILGVDSKESWQTPQKHIQMLFQRQFDKLNDPDYLKRHVARLVLLHNPAYFRLLPHDIQNNLPTLVFSGHLHSGQFGIRSFFGRDLRDQFPETVVSLSMGWPDHGWWCFDQNDKVSRALYTHQKAQCKKDILLYCHAGTGFYGLPLRVGTENELPWIMNISIAAKV